MCGPFFLLSAVGTGMLQNSRAGVLLLCALHISALLCAMLLPHGDAAEVSSLPAVSKGANPLGRALSEAVNATLTVGGFVVFFSALFSVCEAAGLFSLAGRILAPLLPRCSPELLEAFLKGLLEITSGASAVAACPEPLPVRLGALGALSGWGGCCTLMQAAAFLSGSGIKPGKLVFICLLRGLICMLLAYCATLLFF